MPSDKPLRCNFVLNDNLEKFWAIEEIPVNTPPLYKEEQICEDYFNKTVSRDCLGIFVVRFPFKDSPLELGESRDLAIKRLTFQENRIKKDDVLKNKYFAFINEYIELEHMREFKNTDLVNMFRCFFASFCGHTRG